MIGNSAKAFVLLGIAAAGIGLGTAFLSSRERGVLVIENPAAISDVQSGTKEDGETVPERADGDPAPLGDEAVGTEPVQEVVVPDEVGARKPDAGQGTIRADITDRLVGFGDEATSGTRKIDTVVLHSSYNNQGGSRYAAEKVIAIWEGYEVAPHYLIDRQGKIFRLVRENDVAYHAGVSKMPDGRRNVNEFSLGVELLNAEDDTLTAAQYGALNNLLAFVREEYGVRHVVGHSDIAPDRKTDPWNLDWKKVE